MENDEYSLKDEFEIEIFKILAHFLKEDLNETVKSIEAKCAKRDPDLVNEQLKLLKFNFRKMKDKKFIDDTFMV